MAIQPVNHQVTWDEFKAAFREHYIPEGVLHMKQEEFMKLQQGGDTITQYLNKFQFTVVYYTYLRTHFRKFGKNMRTYNNCFSHL